MACSALAHGPTLLTNPRRGATCTSYRRPAAVARPSVVVASASKREAAAPAKESTMDWLQRAALLSLASAPVTALPAAAEDFSQGIVTPGYWVTLGLFVMTAPGLYSLVKRAPKSKVSRKTYEVEGPAVEGAMPMDERARSIFAYFKKYNYNVKDMGETITFVGTFEASQGQAIALTSYVLVGLACCALVLSITVPSVGNWWYAMCLASPAAYTYYMSRGTREEEMQVKMVTSDDDKITEIRIQGDAEEIERFWRELGLIEKGMERVDGLLN